MMSAAYTNASVEAASGRGGTARGPPAFRARRLRRTTLARIVPLTNDGGSAIRLFGIRSDGTLGRWGIHNGDEIVTLDGHPINDPDTLVEAYTDARQRTDLELVVVRDGQPRTLCYHVERR